jgi:predicted  nucleic acid-binding Zn-ribbon protein
MNDSDVQFLIDRAVDALADRITERTSDLEYELKRAGNRVDDLERQIESLRGEVRDLEREARR